MSISEKSFRIGCGRYLQEPGILSQCGEEVRRLGKAPLVIGGKTALELTRGIIEPSIARACDHYKIIEYPGTCNEVWANKFAQVAREEGYDVIVGVGGGVKMDFVKLCGNVAGLPVINIPTSSATCAAYTPHSICYTVEGRTSGTQHHGREVSAVLVDTNIIAAQPVRLLLAGVFDALAKFVEIKHRFHEEDTEFVLGLDWAYVMSKHSYQLLIGKIEQCIADMEAGVVSDTVEQMAFTTIAATGVISGVARGANQSALAHEFYEKTRILFPETAKPYLHGEIVGVGLLLQNYVNQEEEKNQALRALMQKYGMPQSVREIGVDMTQETLEKYEALIRESDTVREEGEEGARKLRAGLEYLWSV